MRIGVFGGSFDPIHNAHLIAALTAREALGLDQVRLIVAGEQPLKGAGHRASAEARFEMVALAVAGVPGLVADRSEIDRPGPSWTYETLRFLHATHPAAQLVLLLGADAAAQFDQWHNPAGIRDLAQIAVCARGGRAAPPGFDVQWTVPDMELSSSAIRIRAAAGLPLAGWVPEGVASYISGLRLYGSSIA